MQAQLPVWLTCIHEESFVKAGELGVGVLGYLMNQTVDEVAAKIAKYREALARHGHDPAKGHVTILVHTFVGDDADAARERARGPLKEYLRSFLDNSQKRLESQNGRPWTWRRKTSNTCWTNRSTITSQGKALIGTPESCAAVVERLREIGVDEIGCFIDFGVDPDAVLASLPALNHLRERYATTAGVAGDRSNAFSRSPRRRAACGCSARRTTTPCAPTTNPPRSNCAGRWMPTALRRALQAAVNRHEALRTTIQPDGESQIIHPETVVERAADRPIR